MGCHTLRRYRPRPGAVAVEYENLMDSFQLQVFAD